MTKDFLTLFDITAEELEALFVLSDTLKDGSHAQPLRGKFVAMIFQKPSLRTRVSFEVGISQLGGHPVVLSQEGIGLGARESAPDVHASFPGIVMLSLHGCLITPFSRILLLLHRSRLSMRLPTHRTHARCWLISIHCGSTGS